MITGEREAFKDKFRNRSVILNLKYSRRANSQPVPKHEEGLARTHLPTAIYVPLVSFVAPAAPLHARRTHTQPVRRSTHAGAARALRVQPTLGVARRQRSSTESKHERANRTLAEPRELSLGHRRGRTNLETVTVRRTSVPPGRK